MIYFCNTLLPKNSPFLKIFLYFYQCDQEENNIALKELKYCYLAIEKIANETEKYFQTTSI